MEDENKKVVINIDQNRKHAACATQVESQLGKKSHTHDTDSWKQANTQGRCVRETQAIIGKRQGWGFTLHTPTWRRPCQCRNIMDKDETGVKWFIIVTPLQPKEGDVVGMNTPVKA